MTHVPFMVRGIKQVRYDYEYYKRKHFRCWVRVVSNKYLESCNGSEMEKENMMKENDMIKVHFYSNNREIKTRNFDKVFKVYKKHGKLGIDWNTERSSYTCKGDVFTSFETFSNTIIFENVETGEKFHFDNVKNEVVKESVRIENYPVSLDKYTKEEAPYIYTEYAERFANDRPNLESRTAGTIACFAGEPIQPGMTANAWLESGFVERR